MVQGAGFEPA